MTELRIVVGSGPNAVAVTHALLERGFEVLMLDVGTTIEPEVTPVVDRMARQEPEQWSKEDKALIRRTGFDDKAALNPKRTFGSSFAYHLDAAIDAPEGVRLYGSQAFGGLSNVWGCALLKVKAAELSGWPVDVAEDVVCAYPKIEDLVRCSIGVDMFAPHPEGTHLSLSTGARSVLQRFARAPEHEIDIFPTPLAIAPACKACNACMYGCVYDLTYSSRMTVESVFKRNPRFRYLGGVEVQRFTEIADGIEIHATDPQRRRAEVFHGKQIFLAAGLMGTLRILWNSVAGVSRELNARDASCFIIPGFLPSLTAGRRQRHHGQSHLSADLLVPPFEHKPAHFQLYFNNPAVADGLKSRLPPLRAKPLAALTDFANRYLVFAQGYLHSDFSHALKLVQADGRIKVSAVHNPQTAQAIDIAVSRFVRAMRRMGVILLKRFADVTPFGGSKTAGALPHANAASPTATDPLGRPIGSNNVFVVDATVLGSIPGRNLTLTTMANAYRIGRAA
jgi:choline dehydrogenase-like flavoprotein